MFIVFGQSSELFSMDEAIITIKCKHLPEMFKQPHRCAIDEIKALEQRITLHALKEIVSRMAKQRFENLNHSQTMTSDQLEAFTNINHSLVHYKLHDQEILSQIFSNRIALQ